MLEAKTLTIKKSTNKSGQVVNFIPEMVDGKEVYSVVNKNNDHCGYITEALFNLLMEQDPEEKENKALFHRALGVDDEEKEEETLIFGKKIILDVSSTKDINDFEKIILSPVTYTKGAKPLTIKIGTFFCIQNQGKLLDINVKSDFIECDNFLVSNLTSTKLNIDLNNKSPYFGGIHLYGIENFQNPGGEINLHIKANSKNGYYSINIHQLSIDSEKIGVKNPLHIGFEFGDGVLNACYTSFDNVYVGDTETGGFGFLKIGDKGDSPDSSILNTFKNVNIYMEGADTFIVKGGNALSFTSCDFDGNTYIETKSSNPSISYKVSATNSKFTNSSLRFSSHDGSGTIINNSEIEGDFVCDSVKEISASYLENVKLESLDRVESCYLSAYIYENDGKRANLINVNSNEEKILPKDTKLEIL